MYSIQVTNLDEITKMHLNGQVLTQRNKEHSHFSPQQ